MKGWVGLVGGRFTHINGYQSAAGPLQASESSPVRDRRSSTKQVVYAYLTTILSFEFYHNMNGLLIFIRESSD